LRTLDPQNSSATVPIEVTSSIKPLTSLLDLVVKVLLALSVNIPTTVKSLQSSLDSLHENLEDVRFLFSDHRDYLENGLPGDLFRSIKEQTALLVDSKILEYSSAQENCHPER